jgi:decaprenylphospho-beta-D-ribofuranose 2-oxidase
MASVFPVVGKEFYFRMFGRGGFREYQVLLPAGAWEEADRSLRALIRRHGVPVTLASLKLFRGKTSMLNFEGEGVCLAVDAPEGPGTRALFSDLDELTISLKGIVNVAKDSRIGAALVRRVYPDYELFKSGLAAFDPGRRFDSALRRRIGV